MSERKYKVVVVDNEEETRHLLIDVLKLHDDILISWEASDAHEALQKIAEVVPDLVFVACGLPIKDGFAVYDELKKNKNNGFDVVFLTHDCEHAQKAIKLGAFDYLMKPLNTVELEKTLLKFRIKHDDSHQQKQTIMNEILPPLHSKVGIPTPLGHLYVDPKDIAFIKSKKKHTLLTDSGNLEHETCLGLKMLVSELHDSCIIVVHKSYAINRRFLHTVPAKNNSCTLKIGDKVVEIPLSRKGKKNLNK